MLEFLVTLLIYGKADINDNYHVYCGQDPRTEKRSPVIAVEYTVDF